MNKQLEGGGVFKGRENRKHATPADAQLTLGSVDHSPRAFLMSKRLLSGQTDEISCKMRREALSKMVSNTGSRTRQNENGSRVKKGKKGDEEKKQSTSRGSPSMNGRETREGANKDTQSARGVNKQGEMMRE